MHNHTFKPILPRRFHAGMRNWIAIAALSVTVFACSGGGSDDGGIIGTGIRLDGTASSTRAYASNNVEIKARSGERTTAALNNNGRFTTQMLEGEGPFLMRADLGNGEYLYSIGHDDGNGQVRRNIHSYTDAAIRNWFASNGADIDSAFVGTQAIGALPSNQQINAILDSLYAIVAAVLGEYDLTGADIATDNYEANGTGIDLYLENNPVLVNNGNITIIVTDQTTRTLTEATTNVPLTTDFTAIDSEAPSAPTAIRALPAKTDEIVIVWEAAKDNIGVTTYEIYRDGVSVATTPFPVFTDTNLITGVVYNYVVVAIDASGNESPNSSIATSQTLEAADTQAPPAPQGLLVSANSNNVAINWSQSEIGDVAAFNVSRTTGNGSANTIAVVTATFMTDTNVMSGTEYCYQVTAVDASGNESPATGIVCDTTTGSVITPPDENNNDNTGALTAPMVDVTNMSCTETLERDVNVDTTLARGCYLANDGIFVNEPANLTLQPGVVIKFGAGEVLFVESGASLTAEANSNDPIVLSGQEPSPGFWDGVRFFYSNSINNRLDHVQIEYAGGGINGNLVATSTSSSPTRVSVSNTSLLNGSAFGFNFDNGTLVDRFERNKVTGNATSARISPNTVTALDTASQYSGNTSDIIQLTNNDVSVETTFENLDANYRTSNLSLDNKLTIKPGVTIEFSSNAQLFVDSSGTLDASGTAANPILFTSTEPTPGYWDGVRLFYSNTRNKLEHVTIEYGGSANSGSGNLVVTATNTSPSQLVANHVTLRFSQNNGFVFDSGPVINQFTNITSTGNGRVAQVEANSAHLIGSGSNFIGNTNDEIRVESNTISQDVVWLAHGVPYSIENLDVQAKLDLSPGSTLVMDAGSEVFVNSTGALSAVGTASQPITFTGKEPTPGYWDGIRFFYSPTVSNRLEHVVVEYGGGGTGDASGTGNIRLTCTSVSPSRLSIVNTMSNFSLGWGMFVDDSGCIVTEGANVTYSGNGVGSVNLAP